MPRSMNSPRSSLGSPGHLKFFIRGSKLVIMRERPLREKKPKKMIEADPGLRAQLAQQFTVPDGAPEFKAGYRECISMFVLHAPNKRQVGRILDEYCITLEEACMREMSRENIAAYEGYRQAIKDLRRMKRIR